MATDRLINNTQGTEIINALTAITNAIGNIDVAGLHVDWSYTVLPATGNSNIIYAIPTGDTEDPYDFYAWNDADQEFVQIDFKIDITIDSSLSSSSTNPVQNAVITTALADKVDTENGKGLSTNDFTDTLKTKLDGIEAGAQVNPTIDSALSDSSENAVQNKVVTAAVSSTKTATGNPVTLTDAAEINAEEVVAEIEPIQDLHGYDHPWVGGAGKNKLPMTLNGVKASNATGTWSGNTYAINGGTITVSTDNDGNITVITVNGTFNAQVEFKLTNPSNLDNSFYGYILNGSPAYPNSDIALLVSYIENGVWKGEQLSYNEADTTINQSFSTIIFSIYVKSGTSVTNKAFYPMLRLSTETDPTFAPYTNICPISGLTSVDVESVGKNLIDATTLNLYDVTGTGTMRAGYAPITLAVGTYTVSWASANTGLILTNITDGYSYATLTNGESFTLNSTSEIMVRTGATSVGDVSISNIQLEKGNQATTYEPYQSHTTTTSLGRTVYGGTLNMTTGVLTVDRAIVDLGTLTWNKVTGGSDVFFQSNSLQGTIKPPINNTTVSDSLSSGFIFVAWQGGAIASGVAAVCGATDANAGRLSFQWFDYNDKSSTEFKTAVTGQTICYPLATPTTYQLTTAEVALLADYCTVSTNADNLSVEYWCDNIIGTLIGRIQSLEARVKALEEA